MLPDLAYDLVRLIQPLTAPVALIVSNPNHDTDAEACRTASIPIPDRTFRDTREGVSPTKSNLI